MEKKCIKRKVISAYKDAKRYPDFMPRFKANLQDVIDSEVLEQDSSSTIPGPGHQPGRKKPTNKVPYYFTLKSNDVFGFAGLYD